VKTIDVDPLSDRPPGSVTVKLNDTVTGPSDVLTLLVSNGIEKPDCPLIDPVSALVGSFGSLALKLTVTTLPWQTWVPRSGDVPVIVGGWFGGDAEDDDGVGVGVGVGVTGGPGAVVVAVGGRVVLRVVVGSADEADESLGDSDGSEGASVTTVGGSRLASAPTGSAVPSPHAGGGPDVGSRFPFSDTDPDATSAADGSAVNRTVPAVSSEPASVSIRSDKGRNADEELAVFASMRPWLIRNTAVGVIGCPDGLISSPSVTEVSAHRTDTAPPRNTSRTTDRLPTTTRSPVPTYRSEPVSSRTASPLTLTRAVPSVTVSIAW
jgi:hypothetical protein